MLKNTDLAGNRESTFQIGAHAKEPGTFCHRTSQGQVEYLVSTDVPDGSPGAWRLDKFDQAALAVPESAALRSCAIGRPSPMMGHPGLRLVSPPGCEY